MEKRAGSVVTGTGIFVNAPPSGTDALNVAGEDLSFNFVEADVKEVVKSVLGTTLKLPFVIDPRVQGTVTLQTSRPVSGAEALRLLQSALRADGAALVGNQGAFSVVPLADAAAQAELSQLSPAAASARAAGFTVKIISLRNISATEMVKSHPAVPAG